MSVSQQEADLITENRELRQRLQGALADLEDAKQRNARAQEHHTRQDLTIQRLTREKAELIQRIDTHKGGR